MGTRDDLSRRMVVVEGDITRLDVDAIVNAANEQLAPGGGVCGAIHRAAGPELWAECQTLGGCATGDAKITRGYRLKARHVIHAAGPVWHGGDRRERDLLAGCYRGALRLADGHGLRTIAFPALSTGIFGFPPELAAPIAVGTVARELARLPNISLVQFCCFSAASARLHRTALAALS